MFRGDDLEHAEVFDLRDDPAEQHDLADRPEAAAIVARAREVVARHMERAAALRDRHRLAPVAPPDVERRESELRELRALGYLEE